MANLRAGVSLVGAWSFLDTEITGDLFVPSGANLKGRQGAFAPDISGNISYKLGDQPE